MHKGAQAWTWTEEAYSTLRTHLFQEAFHNALAQLVFLLGSHSPLRSPLAQSPPRVGNGPCSLCIFKACPGSWYTDLRNRDDLGWKPYKASFTHFNSGPPHPSKGDNISDSSIYTPGNELISTGFREGNWAPHRWSLSWIPMTSRLKIPGSSSYGSNEVMHEKRHL